MALFGGKKEEKKGKAVIAKQSAAKKTESKAPSNAADVLVRPHVTEKAAQATAQNVYTFEVRKDATKGEIASAVEAVYKVKPVKVGLVKIPASRVRLRTRRGYGNRQGMKKAYVYLKKGDRIEFAS